MGRIAQETAKGLKWGALQKCTLQPIQFIFGIILARLLSPAEMGILGLTGLFFAVAGQLQGCGFAAGLIRKQDRTDTDICTVFWFNVGMSAILSGCLFMAAPWFADFFHQPALVNLTRVSALLMFISSTGGVHFTLYTARRDFKVPAIIAIISTLVPMPFTIWAAYSGWSYWSLMVQTTISATLNLSIIWWVSPWKPKLKWSWESFHYFFGFGSKLMLSSMVWVVYSELRTFIIGKFYSPAALGYFTRGYRTCSTPHSVIQGVLGHVTYPILATLQHDNKNLIAVYRKYIKLTALIVEWVMITMAANSEALIVTLYGSKWMQAAVYAQILFFSIMLDPLSNINSNLYNVLGRSDMNLLKEIITRAIGLPALIVGAYFSVEGVCYAAFLTGWSAFCISLIITSVISDLKFTHQLMDFGPYLLMAIIANIPSFLLQGSSLSSFFLLFIGVSSSFCIYCILLWLRRDEACLYLLNLSLSSSTGKRIAKYLPFFTHDSITSNK